DNPGAGSGLTPPGGGVVPPIGGVPAPIDAVAPPIGGEGPDRRDARPLDWWDDLAKWWEEASRKAMENDDAQYRRELEAARQTGDLTAVAAVQAKWTVRGTITGDSRFNGADLKNFEKIAEQADKLSPGEKLEFYLRLGAEIFKGKDGDGKNTRQFLADLANSPRAIRRMGQWSAGMGPGARERVNRLKGMSAGAGLSALARNTSRLGLKQGGPPFAAAAGGVGLPPWWSPGGPSFTPPSAGGRDTRQRPEFGLSVLNVTLSSLGQMTDSWVNMAQSGIDFSLGAAAYGDKVNPYLIKDYEDFVRVLGPAGKFIDGAGYFLGFAQFAQSLIDIRDSNMTTAEKWGAGITEGVFGIAQAATGTAATAYCAGKYSGNNALACGAALSSGIEFGGNWLKDYWIDVNGWDYGP
ncbi:hypothetical protein, partial [Calidithermus terrae]|uniref:hypothetical protein n=1 Tax=Calidithermus terrae TaxID=1408545 RepID=UPI001C3FD32A